MRVWSGAAVLSHPNLLDPHMIKHLLVYGGAAVAGNMIAERFILKDGPDDPSGFVEVKPGFGMDDIARALTIAALAIVAQRFVK